MPPRAIDNAPVHPAVMDAAPNKAVDGVPPSVNVTLSSLSAVNGCPVAALPLNVSQTGALGLTPSPVCCKNLGVVVMLPANVTSWFDSFAYMMLPAGRLVKPVPPYGTVTGVPCHVPDVTVLSEVSDEFTTFDASVEPVMRSAATDA